MSAGNGAGADGAPVERRVWDPLLRLFHWSLVVLFTASYLLGEIGPNIMTLHFWSGYAICGLLVFRVIWGLAGPRHARFSDFIAGPGRVLAYARHVGARRPSHWPGHNPLGGWSVVAFLVLLTGQVVTGLLADPEDYVNYGPLAYLVDPAMNRFASVWHEIIGKMLLALIFLHVAVMLFYRFWKREDLIGPMVHGRKKVTPGD